MTETESILRDRISRAYPRYWDENHITYSILEEFEQKFKDLSITDYPNGLHTRWSAYKFTGNIETKFGDIGILVNIVYDDGSRLEGVAFLEAKRRSRWGGGKGDTRFVEIREPQESAILYNAPLAQYLLYDYDVIQYERFFLPPNLSPFTK